MGADHLEWVRCEPRRLVGIDLTARAVEHTRARFAAYGVRSHVDVGDAEALPFEDESFDLVYSYGVLHHSPDTQRTIDEVHRVLKPSGTARVMIYHRHSLVGYMLWVRYALLRGCPFTPLKQIYAERLESPGTKAFTLEEARGMFARFAAVDARVQLTFGDLLEGAVGQRHGGVILDVARRLWPRGFVRRHLADHGLALLVDAKK
jgi:SAM-dependent methyltransferase